MPKVTVNGIQLYYEQHGKGKPLVLIAGFTCDTTFWGTILDELAHHFQVTIFDNRGVGQSDCPDHPYTIEMMANDALSLMDHLKLDKPYLLGHSMGGSIVQFLAVHHPQRFAKIVISNSLIKLKPIGIWAERFLLLLRQDQAPPRRIIESVLPWVYSNDFLANEPQVEQAIQLQLQHPHPITITGFKHQLHALTTFDSSTWFNQIKIPTLVIGSDEDLLCPQDSNRLAEGIVDAQSFHFPRMGHLPHLEKPAEYKRVVLNFLKESNP